MRDIGVRPAGQIRNRLNPARLVVALPRGPVGLDVDRLDDTAAFDVAAVLGDRIKPEDRLVGAEDARHWWPGQPRQIVQPPDMMVRVDGGQGFHRRHAYGFAAGSAASPKNSAAIRTGSIAAGTPQYIATSSSTSCTCAAVQPFASAPLAWTRNSAGLLPAAVMPSITRLRIASVRPGRSQTSP